MDNKAYQILDVTISTENDMYKDRVDFWLVDIPKIIHSEHNSSTVMNGKKQESKRQEGNLYIYSNEERSRLLFKPKYPIQRPFSVSG